MAIQEFLFLCECEQFVLTNLEYEIKEFHFNKQGNFFKAHGEQAAASLRTFLGYKENELLKDIFNDFRKIGNHIFRRKLSNSDISGLFINHPYAGKCVLINYSEDTYRQNFTVAHEVAHSIFDFDEEFNVSFNSDKWDLKEVRANTFASCFLLPEKAIKDLKITNWSVEILHNIASQLRVNITPLLLRLKGLQLINDDQYNQFRKNYIPKLEKEDFELEGLTDKIRINKKAHIEIGLSTFYVRHCHLAYSKGIISKERLAEMLLTNEFELPSILAPFNLQLIYEY